jgi:hypothetical protein
MSITTIKQRDHELRAYINGFLSDPAHDDQSANSLLAEVFRRAAASLEAEIHSYTFEDDPRPLYTAPPTPVVPGAWEQWIADAVEYLEGGLEVDGELEAEGSIEAKRLLSSRAAMLQGAEPSKMSGIMPDHEGGVMTQRELFQAGWEAHRAAMHRAGAPVQFGWSKGHFGYHTLFNAISKAVNIQGGALSISVSAFEDAMLAAAPQQEVKQCT